MKTKSAFYAKWGVILGGGVVIIKWLMQLANLGVGVAFLFSILYYVIFVYILYFAMRNYKKDYLSDYPTFSQLFRSGFGCILYGAIIVAILMFVYFAFIVDKTALYSAQEILYNTMSPMFVNEDEDMLERMINLIVNPYYLGTVNAISFIFEGAFITLIIGLIMRRKNPNPFAEIEE